MPSGLATDAPSFGRTKLKLMSYHQRKGICAVRRISSERNKESPYHVHGASVYQGGADLPAESWWWRPRLFCCGQDQIRREQGHVIGGS
jgi:hypothetical protein